MRNAWILALLVATAALPAGQVVQAPYETVSPEQAGFSADKLAALTAHLEKAGSAAFLVLRDGKAFYSWGNVEKKYRCHSIRKALLNSVFGIYVDRGRIDLERTLGQLGIDDLPPVLTDSEKKARILDLLQSRSGVYHPAAAETEDMEAQRPARGSHEPGTFFYYNNWDFNVLGTIFEKAVGKGIFEAFAEEIAGPIGMQDYRVEDGQYGYEREKSLHPSYSFRMSARDLALYGQLYLQNGVWKGKAIVPRAWIEASVRTYSIKDPQIGLGYGYLWGTLPESSPFGRAIFHSGLGVHVLMILPVDKLVIVNRVDTDAPYHMTSEALLQSILLLMAAKKTD